MDTLEFVDDRFYQLTNYNIHTLLNQVTIHIGNREIKCILRLPGFVDNLISAANKIRILNKGPFGGSCMHQRQSRIIINVFRATNLVLDYNRNLFTSSYSARLSHIFCQIYTPKSDCVSLVAAMLREMPPKGIDEVQIMCAYIVSCICYCRLGFKHKL